MNFSTAVRVCLSDYVTFSTRAPRSEYWWFGLFGLLLTLAGVVLDSLLRVKVFESLCSLFLLLPNLAVSVRRLHDLDRSGWWLLIGLIPLVGAIVLIIWFVRAGTPGVNRFGAPRLVLP